MKIIKYVLSGFLIFHSIFSVQIVQAEGEEENGTSTEEIVGENDVRQENHSDYEVPSSEDLEGVSEMEVVNNVDEKGNVFDHENLVGTKQFLTVVTPDGRTYYIVISYEQFGTKVHLLKDMTESDVESVTDNQPQAGEMTQAQAEQVMEEKATENEDEDTSKTSSNNVNYIIIGIGVVAGGVIGYLKLKKGKENNSDI